MLFIVLNLLTITIAFIRLVNNHRCSILGSGGGGVRVHRRRRRWTAVVRGRLGRYFRVLLVEAAVAHAHRVVQLFRRDGGQVVGAVAAEHFAAAPAMVLPTPEPEVLVTTEAKTEKKVPFSV